QGGEGASFAGQGEDVGCGAFTGPVPGGQPGQPGQPFWCAGVVPGQPLVEKAQREAGAGGDGSCGIVRGFGLGLVQDPGGERGVAVGDGFGGEPHGDGGQLAGVPDGGEHGQVAPPDGAVHRLPPGARVGAV